MTEIITITLISVALAADAFAVTISNSMCYRNITKWQRLSMPLFFGLFQGLMPLLGYYLGTLFADAVQQLDHWIALVLLSFLGIKMIVEAVREKRKERIAAQNGEDCACDKSLGIKTVLVQAVATSIDALAVGVTLAVTVSLSIWVCSGIIAGITFVISALGLVIGKAAGKLLKDYSQIAGGLILIAIGIKIFIEHMLGA